MLLAAMLMGYGFGIVQGKMRCRCDSPPDSGSPGISSGCHFRSGWACSPVSACAPRFLLALNNAVLSETIWGSILFFLAMFLSGPHCF